MLVARVAGDVRCSEAINPALDEGLSYFGWPDAVHRLVLVSDITVSAMQPRCVEAAECLRHMRWCKA